MSLVANAIVPLTAFAQQGFTGSYNPFGFGSSNGNVFSNPAYYSGGGGYGGGFGGAVQTRPAMPLNNLPSILGIAETILGYFQVIVFIVAIFYILKAALSYARGKPDYTSIGFAILGMAIAILVFAVPSLICWLTQSTGGAVCNL